MMRMMWYNYNYVMVSQTLCTSQFLANWLQKVLRGNPTGDNNILLYMHLVHIIMCYGPVLFYNIYNISLLSNGMCMYTMPKWYIIPYDVYMLCPNNNLNVITFGKANLNVVTDSQCSPHWELVRSCYRARGRARCGDTWAMWDHFSQKGVPCWRHC